MVRMTFEWDAADDAEGHARNDIRRSESSTYPIPFGRTRAGKYLAVVWSATGSNPPVVRVITAYEVSRPGRRP